MTEAQVTLFASTTQTLIGNLADIAIEEGGEDGLAENEPATPERSLEDHICRLATASPCSASVAGARSTTQPRR